MPFLSGNSSFQQIQSAANGTNSVTFSKANTTGNLLVAVIYDSWMEGNAGTDYVSDSAGNSWIGSIPTIDTNGGGLQIWYAENIVANASNTVTGKGEVGSILIMEFSGAATNNVLDVVQNAVGSIAGATMSTGSFTPIRNDLIVAGFETGAASHSSTFGSGFAFFLSDPNIEFSTENNASAGTHSGVSVNPSESQYNSSNTIWSASAIGFRAKSTVMPIAATKLAITSAPINAPTWTCSLVTIQAEDSGGTPRSLQKNIALTLSGSGMYYFSDSACTDSISNLYMWAGQQSTQMYVQVGITSATLTATPLTGFNTLTQSETASLAGFTWIGGTSSSWTTATNWSGNIVPTSTSNVIFDGNCTSNCSLTLPASAITVASMTLEPAYTGTITAGASGASLTINNALDIMGGTLTGNTTAMSIGSLFMNTSGNFNGPSLLNVTGSSFIFSTGFSDANTIEFTGTSATLNNPQGTYLGIGNLIFNNASAVFNIIGGTFQALSVTVTAGVLSDSAGYMSLNVASNVAIAGSGAISLSKGSTLATSGGTTIAAGGSLALSGGSNFSLNSSTFSNAGTVSCTGTNAQLVFFAVSAIANTGTFNTPSCTLLLEPVFSNVAINGNYTLGGLNIIGSGSTVTFQAGHTINVGSLGLSITNSVLRSSTSGTQWNITPSAADTVGPTVDVKDSKNTSSYTLHSGTGYTNSGNNTNWTFP